MTDYFLEQLKLKLRDFADARDWVQFHSPKNVSMALIAEAAEIVEHFQWLTESQSAALPESTRAQVALEIADVQLYLVRLADKLNIDIQSAVEQKLQINAEKYPKEKVAGSAKKYSEYDPR